ncbi:MAG: hypothetical protein U9O85_11070 [Euryarchaeota archaeon]|nr:hypothetical protein [Euryarchaeota archaeon]
MDTNRIAIKKRCSAKIKNRRNKKGVIAEAFTVHLQGIQQFMGMDDRKSDTVKKKRRHALSV